MVTIFHRMYQLEYNTQAMLPLNCLLEHIDFMHIKFWMLINYKQPAPGRYPGKEDEMDKQQFIDFLNQHYGDSDIFDSPSIEIV